MPDNPRTEKQRLTHHFEKINGYLEKNIPYHMGLISDVLEREGREEDVELSIALSEKYDKFLEYYRFFQYTVRKGQLPPEFVEEEVHPSVGMMQENPFTEEEGEEEEEECEEGEEEEEEGEPEGEETNLLDSIFG